MPVEFLAYVVQRTTWLQALFSPSWSTLSTAFLILVTGLAYRFFQGTANPYDAVNMHGKVVLLTGGTSGIGAAVARELASNGAQLILLVRDVKDGWTQEYIATLRRTCSNDLIYAEECDLGSLHSIRTFGTRWIDSQPVRRLDQVILCAGITQPFSKQRVTTEDGVEVQFGINYLANHHLLSILSPALRAQHAERDVRVIATTCTAYILAAIDLDDFEFMRRGYPARRPWQALGASKLYLTTMMLHFQTLIDGFQRPDKLPSRVKCLVVDPGLARTASTRRFISCGTFIGLFAYLATYPIWYIALKSAENAAQGILFASMAPSADVAAQGELGVRGGQIYQECRVKSSRREEVNDVEFGKALWTASEKYVKDIEVRSALARKAAEKQK